MRYQFSILLLALFSTFNVFSQEKYIQHVVAKGETVFKIAQQYHVQPLLIYQINPDAKKGINYKQKLLIPVTDKNQISTIPESAGKQKEHLVVSKETVYGIARQYGVKVIDLYKLNPSLEKKGIRVGQTITVPDVDSQNIIADNAAAKEVLKPEIKEIAKEPAVVETKEVIASVLSVDSDGNKIKEVLAKETLYGIARENSVSVADLQKANPVLLSQSLRVGQKLIIPTNTKPIAVEEKVVVIKKEDSKEIPEVKKPVITTADNENTTSNVVPEIDAKVEITHEIVAKETKYGIAKEYGLTVKELEEQNPQIAKKFLIGEKLTIRTLKSNVKTPSKELFSEAISQNNEEPNYNFKSFHGTDFVDQLIATASDNIGVRYRTGGTSKDGFDCSGLMCTTFGAYDIKLPRTSFEQSQYGEKINNEDAKKGDLIFFRTNGRSRINHVGMVVEVVDGDIKFIHSSVGGGVIISSIKEKYYSKRVTQINRVL
ncbi:MAG: LysM peptidoglycan-binding domain-containing protein [Flavobacterium sp.]